MYQTKTLYTVTWDNNETYEDHATGIWCVCQTFEKAQEVMKSLTEQKFKDCQLIEECYERDERTKILEVRSRWISKIYCFDLESVTFDIGTIDYIE